MTREISLRLGSLGVPAHLLGYKYLSDAIQMIVDNKGTMLSMTKVVYPIIAKTYNSTPSRVERDMRHAIEVASHLRDMKKSTYKFYITGLNYKPTNTNFIATIADAILLDREDNSEEDEGTCGDCYNDL